MHMDHGGGGVLSVPSDHFWGMVALVVCPLAAWLVVCAIQGLAQHGVTWAGTAARRLANLPTAAKAALLASYIGGVVHLVLVQPHWEEDRTRALLFILDVAGFAVAFGWTLLLRPYWRAVSLLMAATTVGGYSFYVLKGWEEVDLVGLVTTTIELAVALVLLVPDPAATTAPAARRLRERWTAGLAIPLALASVLGTNAIATASQESAVPDHGASAAAQDAATDGHQDARTMPGMQMGTGTGTGTGLPLSLATKSAAGPIVWPVVMPRMEGGMKMVTPNCTSRPNAQQQLAAVKLVNQTVAAASKYTSLAVAKAAGYVPVTPTGLRVVHYINYSAYLEHTVLDPSSIPVLVYVNTEHGAVLSAAMYMAPIVTGHVTGPAGDVVASVSGTPCESGEPVPMPGMFCMPWS